MQFSFVYVVVEGEEGNLAVKTVELSMFLFMKLEWHFHKAFTYYDYYGH